MEAEKYAMNKIADEILLSYYLGDASPEQVAVVNALRDDNKEEMEEFEKVYGDSFNYLFPEISEEIINRNPKFGEVWSLRLVLPTVNGHTVRPVGQPRFIVVVSNPVDMAGNKYGASDFLCAPISEHTEFKTDNDVLIAQTSGVFPFDSMVMANNVMTVMTCHIDRKIGVLTEEDQDRVLKIMFNKDQFLPDSDYEKRRFQESMSRFEDIDEHSMWLHMDDDI